MKVALIYDRVNKFGGAERVLLALHEMFPDAPLYTSVYDAAGSSWADVFTIHPSFLQQVPFAKKNHELFPFLMPFAFEQFSFDEYDLVISMTSESAKGIVTNSHTKHICYCLTPIRYLWSGYRDYFPNVLFRIFMKPVVRYLRSWDIVAAQRPDVMIAISEEVQRRIQTYYQRESSVIYPPVSLGEARSAKRKEQTSAQQYYLVVSRLVSYKRVDLAVKACNRLKLPLKIIGTGREEANLRRIAGPTISFLGSLTDDEVITYYKNCRALIFPGLEDFGITVVEAQRFGKPVIAFRGGGALETVIDGKTGILFSEQTETALVRALTQFEKQVFKPSDCKEHAERFNKQQFHKGMKQVIDSLFH